MWNNAINPEMVYHTFTVVHCYG